MPKTTTRHRTLDEAFDSLKRDIEHQFALREARLEATFYKGAFALVTFFMVIHAITMFAIAAVYG